MLKFLFLKNVESHVGFEKELEKIKPSTLINYYEPDTLENDSARIKRFTTIEEINHQSDLFLQQLRELKRDKLELKRDISGEFEELTIKLNLLKETKEKILIKG